MRQANTRANHAACASCVHTADSVASSAKCPPFKCKVSSQRYNCQTSAMLARQLAAPRAAAAAASRAASRAPMQQQLARSGVMPTCVTRFAKAVSIVRSWWLFQLPRAARLRKKWPGMGRERAAFRHEDACSRTGGSGLARQCDRARSIERVYDGRSAVLCHELTQAVKWNK